MTIRLEPKRQEERRSLQHDWSPFLGVDTISTQTTTSPDVTISGASIVGGVGGTSVRFNVDAGTPGQTAVITQSIVTAGGDHETEIFLIDIVAQEILSLGPVKEYLGLFTSDKDHTLLQMITRARNWIESHTGIALVRRSFVERLLPSSQGKVRLTYGPLVTVDSVDYLDTNGLAATLTPTSYPPSTELFNVGGWPGLAPNEKFEIGYTAGVTEQDIDDRLIGGMLALIEGEFSEGYAYPDRSLQAARNCCAYLQAMVA
jgi:uncharacterized phiE125 gp8 family phage protein